MPNAMSQVILKYTLTLPPQPYILMPEGARVLHVANQAGFPTIWAAVNPDNPNIQRHFTIVPTGGEVPPSHYYIGTCIDEVDNYVWHIYGRIQHDPTRPIL